MKPSTIDKLKALSKTRFAQAEAYNLFTLRHAPEMSAVVYNIKKALKKGIEPEKPAHTSSHVFFLKDEDGKNIAVFKTDHFVNEFAAFRLDHQNFAGVPPTVLTVLDHQMWDGAKMGSLQLFIDDAIPAVNLRREAFRNFSAKAVRRIAALDIRCMNGDRHTSNLLVRNRVELIPIDHEFILQNLIYIAGLHWMTWGQASTEFDQEELTYIAALDPDEDRKILLEELGFDKRIAIRNYIATSLLKSAAIRKIPPAILGHYLKRENFKDKSPTVFELLLERIEKYEAFNWTFFSHRVYEEVERTLDEKVCV